MNVKVIQPCFHLCFFMPCVLNVISRWKNAQENCFFHTTPSTAESCSFAKPKAKLHRDAVQREAVGEMQGPNVDSPGIITIPLGMHIFNDQWGYNWYNSPHLDDSFFTFGIWPHIWNPSTKIMKASWVAAVTGRASTTTPNEKTLPKFYILQKEPRAPEWMPLVSCSGPMCRWSLNKSSGRKRSRSVYPPCIIPIDL